MELSEKLFGEITGVTDEGPIYEAVQHERRKYPRVSFGSRAYIFPLFVGANTRGQTVLVRDMSRSGIGLLFGEELATGDEFVIRLPRKSGPSIDVQCMVARCEPGGVGGGNFVIGATFELVIDENAPEPSTMKPADVLSVPSMSCPLPLQTHRLLDDPRPRERGPGLFSWAFWRSLGERMGPIRDQYKLRRRLRRGRSSRRASKSHAIHGGSSAFAGTGASAHR